MSGIALGAKDEALWDTQAAGGVRPRCPGLLPSCVPLYEKQAHGGIYTPGETCNNANALSLPQEQ